MIKKFFFYIFLREIKSNMKLISYLGGKDVFVLSWLKTKIAKTTNKDKLWSLWEKKHNVIISYIQNNLSKYRDEEYHNCIGTNKNIHDDTIWVFWWQGEDFMPDIVSVCYKQLKKHSGKHSVILITKNNIQDYLSVPECIVNKIGRSMTYTHFSDYVRLNLLAIYGGLWIDSTFLFTKDIDESIFEYNFFSIKNNPVDNQCVCKYRWAVNFMYVKSNSDVMYHVRNMFAAFCENNSSQLDYLFIDYCFEMEARLNEKFNEYLEHIPKTNEDCHELRIHFNEPYDEKMWDKWTSNTNWFKLTYKGELVRNTNEYITYYGYIIDNMR